MKLRTRLFLFVACVFFFMQLTSLLWTYYSIHMQASQFTDKLEREIKENNKNQVEDYLSFLVLSIAEVELRINSLFGKIQQFEWLKGRYAPSVYNFQTNQWSNSASLIAAHEWVDLIQTTIREKLTSLIIMKPPYLRTLYRVPLNELITLIVDASRPGDLECYIGVPFWSNEAGTELELGLHDVLFSLDIARNTWLFFKPDQLLGVDPDEMVFRGLDIPNGPFQPEVEIEGQKVYANLVKLTKEMVLKVRNQLLQNPEQLEKLRDPHWVREQVDKVIASGQTTFPRGLDACQSHLCQFMKKNPREGPWANLHDWRERDDQNRLIWELGTITGTGLWYFDPLNQFAPTGIASFPRAEWAAKEHRSADIGYGLVAKDAFKDERLVIHPSCKPEFIQGKVTTCLSPEFEILRAPDDPNALYLSHVLLYEESDKETQEPAFGTLTLGVDITHILEELALISPDQVLFILKEGPPLMFDTHGNPIKLTEKQNKTLLNLSGKKEGIIVDNHDKQFYFLHVANITEDDGQVFLVQSKDSVFKQIIDLENQADVFLYSVSIQICVVGVMATIIVLILVSFYVKRVVRPIQELAHATQFVATGELEKIVFAKEDDRRKDEIGTLVHAFGEMVENMKEGNKVRAVLHKVVNKDVANKILKQGVELGGEIRQVAILFSDIRDFTHISENMAPQDVLAMLNDCLNVLSQVIDDHKGVIDKYVGDAIMAFFGAPVATENPPLQAILCSITMMRVLNEWNRHRASIAYKQLKIGIGIHVGEVIAGNMGAENHLNYTILGHNVNLASRLCDHAKEMEILITEAVLNAPGVRAAIEVETVPEATFKGISTPIAIFRVKY